MIISEVRMRRSANMTDSLALKEAEKYITDKKRSQVSDRRNERQ